MPAYEITLISHILIFLLQNKDRFIFKHNHTVYTHTCVLSAPRLAGCVNVPERRYRCER